MMKLYTVKYDFDGVRKTFRIAGGDDDLNEVLDIAHKMSAEYVGRQFQQKAMEGDYLKLIETEKLDYMCC